MLWRNSGRLSIKVDLGNEAACTTCGTRKDPEFCCIDEEVPRVLACFLDPSSLRMMIAVIPGFMSSQCTLEARWPSRACGNCQDLANNDRACMGAEACETQLKRQQISPVTRRPLEIDPPRLMMKAAPSAMVAATNLLTPIMS
jgi:hypothetical protein